MRNISLICPTYRNPSYLDIFIRSAIENRVDANNRIVVILDGFAEESKHILDKYPDIQYIDLGQNQGMAHAINAGVALCDTEYVFVVNDDNVMPPEWDRRLFEEIDAMEKRLGRDTFVLTVDQIEPTGPGMFNFPVKDFGKTADTFDYNAWLKYEPTVADKHTGMYMDDGRIFPFVMKKQYYMAVNGFDTIYNSPNLVDWDFFLKLQLLRFMFLRTRYLRLYHFGSVVTKKNAEAAMFSEKHRYASEIYVWKWGCQPYNEPGTNSKIPPNRHFRGFDAS